MFSRYSRIACVCSAPRLGYDPSMLPAPDAVFFDLDGTLVDSVADIAASANHIRERWGRAPLSEALVRSYVGDGVVRLLERALSDAPDVDLQEALAAFRAHYGEHCLDRTRPYPGVVAGLAALRGLPAAVVSNKPQALTERVVRGLDLHGPLRAIVGARSGVPVKPAPDLLRLAREEAGIVDGVIWLVADSPHDGGAGRAIGAVAVAVSYGLGSREVLAAASPDATFPSFPEVIESILDAHERNPR